jgi:hypothetical protein
VVQKVDTATVEIPRISTRLRRLRLRRWRRVVGTALLLLPVLAVVVIDLGRRSDRIVHFEGYYRWTYLGAVLESLVLWATLLYAASRRRGWGRWVAAALFVLGITFSFGGQEYFYQQYHAYLNIDVSLFASNFMDSVVNQLFADIANYIKAKTPPLLCSVALVAIARRVVRPRPLPAKSPTGWRRCWSSRRSSSHQHRHIQAATPTLYLHAVGA